MRIPVAEGDAPLPESLRQQLAREQLDVRVVATREEAQQLAMSGGCDLVLLDLDAPAIFGLDLLRYIKAEKPDLPVLLLTGASAVEDRVRVLDAGADDHLCKPVAFAELAARIRAVLRRGNRSVQVVLKVRDLALDRVTHMVQRSGRSLDLSRREFALLEFLMRHAGQPVTRAAIVENVWKTNFDAATNVVDVYINYLRRKVDNGFDQALIRTIRGVGYQIGGNGTHS